MIDEVQLLRMQLADHGEYITQLQAEIERLRDDSRMLMLCEGDRKEMAAEIGRLRAAHQEIKELQKNTVVSGEGLFMRALLISRRALEPKP